MHDAAGAPAVGDRRFDAERALAADAAATFATAERPDLVHLARIALGRIDRPASLVCVAGDFKQGKSSVVNELVGIPVCPVDDDLATSALTLLHHADQLEARVHSRRDGQTAVDVITTDEIADWVSERGNPDNTRQVERVEIGVPSRFLERGPALIDTPGAGGLNTGAASSVLAFLPFADALLFVTDATAELSASELDYLRRAAGRCPTMMVCVTKIDVCPEWRRIVELDRAHLERAGLSLPLHPVSTTLRGLALRRSDPGLNDESGYPGLLRGLDADVLSTVKELAAQRAVVEVRTAAEELAASCRTELAMLADPERLASTIARLESARERIDQLRGPGSRWNVVLGDRVTDLGNEATHRFRTGLRTVLRESDELFEQASTSEEWKALGAALQQRLAELIGDVFRLIDDTRREIRSEIAALLQDEVADLPAAPARDDGLTELWAAIGSAMEPGTAGRQSSAGVGVDRGLGLLRGAFGAVSLLSILGRLLPATAAAVLLSNPFTLGAGAIFGVKHVRDQRVKHIAAQRQQARAAFRTAVDQAQVEVSKAIGDAVRDVQRTLRDTFAARIQDLHRASTETAARYQADIERDETWREERRLRLLPLVDRLDALAGQARALEGER